MRVYLGVAATHGEIPVRVLDRARSAIELAFPVPPEVIRGREWHGRGVSLFGWSNEPDDLRLPPLLSEHGGRVLGLNGHLADPADVTRLPGDDVGGCFSAWWARDGELGASTAVNRVCPVFHAETPDLHVIGSRALLVHLVAQPHDRVEHDVLALQSMVRQGFFLSDETPYKGVSALRPNARIEMREGRRAITETPLPAAAPAPASRRAKRAALDELADALLGTVAPLRDLAEPVNLALTGGRDTRVLAALLHAARVPFRVTTNGLDTHPDVIIARRIAAELKVEHTVIAPPQTAAKDAVLVEHPLERAWETLRTCEGMTSAYESIVGYLPYSGRPTMSGQSGETLRAGSLNLLQTDLTDQALLRRVTTTFCKDERLFTAEANEHARELARPWQERADRLEALDHMYVWYKVGRWQASARAGALRRGDPVRPFLDNRVVRAALALDQGWRLSEEVIYHLVLRFAPRLRDVPIEGKPWRFAEGMTRRRLPWTRVPPAHLPTVRTGGGWSWRTSPGPVLTDVLRRQVLDGLDALAPIVNPDEVRALFADPVVRKPALAWHLYTVSTLLTGLYPGKRPEGLERITVARPDPAR
ncbi:asparagine synthase-related protein [Actinomadura sp. ATCC 31491]|uniref:Asparagine synthase-related protein n=1 Tax=Actinomadura luzonensis TaxID=2805427 RepID=A0ABT0FZW6_9ACTN|nr:asparagine synthase-related protein [Actinomadura luzonensis]MCK2217840.1 asparagine synthase-related protein [Actinomadura luzonensis]